MKRKILLFLIVFFAVPLYTSASSNCNLSDVKIEGINFKFDKELTEYEFVVPYSHDKLEMTYKPENPKAEVEFIGQEELLVGNNSIVLLVTLDASTSKEYDFTIIRKENNEIVQNNENTIRKGVFEKNADNLTVPVSGGEAVVLPKDVVEGIKKESKTITYEWKDSAGALKASLKIDGTKIGDVEEVNPNTKNTISNAFLKKTLQDSTYIGISTSGTNIPDGSTYSLKVDNKEDIYYLYFYDKNILNKRTLRVNAGYVEFEVKDGVDYAIVSTSEVPKKIVESFSWFWPSLFLVILFLVFLGIMKVSMIRVVRNSAKKENSDSQEIESERTPLKKRNSSKN